MEAPEKMTFSEALLASLKQQRSSLLGNGQKPLCDVILKCGNIATRSHSSVLASVSKYFERILTERHSNTQVCTLYKKQIESILHNFKLATVKKFIKIERNQILTYVLLKKNSLKGFETIDLRSIFH